MVKAFEVEAKPFVLEAFSKAEKVPSSMGKITKKMLKNVADDIGLVYDEKQISFTKKLMTAYLEKLG